MPTLVVALLLSWRWLPSFEVGPLQRQVAPPHPREERPIERTPIVDPPPAPEKTVILPDEIVLRTIDRSRATYLACWRRALAADPLLDAMKIKLRVELDADGTITSVTHDSPNAKLGNCLLTVTRGLKFTAPQGKAVAEFPLFFQPN